MKKVKKNRFFRLPMFRLYREDIEQLYELFSSSSKGFEFIIDDYQIERLDELDKLDIQETTSSEMTSFDPYVRLTIRPYEARIYLSDSDDQKQLGMKAKVEGIVERRCPIMGRRAQGAAGRFLSGFVPGLLSGLSTVLLPVLLLKHQQTYLVFVLPLLLIDAISFFLLYQAYTHYGVIHLARKKDLPGFLSRNLDQILVLLTVGVIVAIISFLLGLAAR